MPRSRLGPLALESKLGDYPSQSIVWRAVHLSEHKVLAVKIFPVPFGGTPESRKRLSLEWEKLKRVRHPAIARCYGGGFEGNDAYLAYELIEGETLAAALERRPRLAWDVVLDFAIPIAEGLATAHAKKVHHGSIAPDKIIISGLAPVLVDLRADRARSVYRSPRRPTPLEIALQAPEVVADPTAISAKSDIYSLSALMYLALTGRPPISGETVEEVAANVASETPATAASITFDCPIWISRLVEQGLAKAPPARPLDAKAFAAALVEARHRSSGLTGVAEQMSSGFSPLQQVTRQHEKDEARKLLGREIVGLEEETHETTDWHEKPWVLISALVLILGVLVWLVWPLNESQMRVRAERLIAEDTRSSLEQAKNSYLIPMLNRFPDGEHHDWAQEQLDEIRMLEAEHALAVKLKRNMPLRDEGERLYAEALRYEQFGDKATAVDKYRSLITLLGDDEKYRPFVNLAHRQIGRIRNRMSESGEATAIVQTKLDEAEDLFEQGNVVAARDIWYSVIELYGDNADVAPLVRTAQRRLAGSE